MIDDEIDGVGPAKAISKRGYYGLVAGIFAALVVVELGIDQVAIHLGLGRVIFGWSGGWKYWLDFFLARYLADVYLKRVGLSRSGPTVEVWAPVGTGPAGEANPHAVIEVKAPRDLSSALGAFCLAACLPVVALGIGLLVQGFKVGAPLAGLSPLEIPLALFGVGVVCGPLGFWLVKRGQSPRLMYRADATGLTDCTWDAFFPWSSVASFRITTEHNPLGEPTDWTHELIGWNGKCLVPLQLDSIPAPDRERLIGFIHARLPKLVKDADWE